MLDWDPKGKVGPQKPIPDVVIIHTPKDDDLYGRVPVIAPEVELIDPVAVVPVAVPVA
ncbi:hypothetical protein SOVF_036170 [Spinacia oleracea]|nr:hypothetical protein SOVF_036170 [Spinacia oleracea]